MQKTTPRVKENTARRMPERFDASEAKRLLMWAMTMGYSAEEIRFAVQSVRDWTETRANAPLKRDWVKTVEVAMRQGWALRGCKKWLEMASTAVNARTGQKVVQRTPITAEYIERYLAALRRFEADA